MPKIKQQQFFFLILSIFQYFNKQKLSQNKIIQIITQLQSIIIDNTAQELLPHCITSMEDRPIQPNKQYLQQKQQQYRERKNHQQYLKKHKIEVLPCFRENITHNKKQSNSPTHKVHSNKTKAKIYDEIKKKNLQKFGDRANQVKKQNQNNQNKDIKKKKKIHPNQMTVSYKPTKMIDTNEQRIDLLKSQKLLKTDQLNNNNLNTNQQPKDKNSPSKYEQTAKQKYQKLLQILRKQKMVLNDQKQDFERQKSKLQFKKTIQSEGSIPFISQIQKSIRQKKVLQKSRKYQQRCNTKQQKHLQNKTNPQKKLSKSDVRNKLKNTSLLQQQNLEQISQKIQSLKQQKQEIEQQVYRNKYNRQLIDQDDVVCHRYSIQQINSIPAFDVESFKQFLDFKTLYPEANNQYQMARVVFQSGLSGKQGKNRSRIQNISSQNEHQSPTNQQTPQSIHFKRRYQGRNRLTKYNNGWIQVWNPGVQRLMSNKQLSYKVVWLKNGDIKQQWKDLKLQSYFNKDKQIVRIKFQNYQPIYFFVNLYQLEQYSADRLKKQVMFKDLRVQEFSTEDDNMNGFTV